jgi:hypothetical protein
MHRGTGSASDDVVKKSHRKGRAAVNPSIKDVLLRKPPLPLAGARANPGWWTHARGHLLIGVAIDWIRYLHSRPITAGTLPPSVASRLSLEGAASFAET